MAYQSDLQSLETSASSVLDRLNNVVAWLHQEGFYAAESALLAEVEHKFPDHADQSRSPTRASMDSGPSGARRSPDDDTIELAMPILSRDESGQESLNSVERVLEAWRSKSTTPAASPRKSIGQPLPYSNPTPFSTPPSPPMEGDEYDDDDDVGYWRVPVSMAEATNRLGPFFTAAMEGASAGGLPSDRSHHPSGLPKSPSTTSLPYSAPHSRHSSLEIPKLHLEAPVVGGSQYVPTPRASSRQGQHPLSSPHCSQPSPRPSTEEGIISSGPRGYHSPGSSDAGGFLDQAAWGGPSTDRRAGTAQWVFDRTNSAGSEAYKSLLTFLDQQSPRTQPLQLASADPSDGEGAALGSARRPMSYPLPPSPPAPPLLPGPKAPPYQGGDSSGSGGVGIVADKEQQRLEPCAEHSARDLATPITILALPEEGAALGGHGHTHEQHHQGIEESCSQGSLTESAMEEVVEEAMAELRLDSSASEACTTNKAAGTYSTSGAVDHSEAGTVHATRGSSPGSACIEDDNNEPAKRRGDKSGNPFSFPVTSPSEQGDGTAPQLFGIGSWPSFKAMGSPQRSAGLPGYCSADDNDDSSTPVGGGGRRRNHRPRLSSGNLAGLPPPGPGLSLKFPQLGRRSNSQQGLASYSSGTPRGPGQYDDLALYDYDEDAVEQRYDTLDLRVIHRRYATGFEATRELPLRINDLIAGRYQIIDLLGQAAFSRAVQALDLKTGGLVCLKVVKNNKDFFDQSLDEIKVLRYVNEADPEDQHGVLRLLDYFYFREHLVLVTELLRANLYEFSKHNRDSGDALYFTPARVQSVARQILGALAFLHSLGLVHADLKPENVLMKSYSACEVKVIDLGSTCFLTDKLSSYVQSRSYRAPEVILGAQYGQKIDIWSLGCIVAELATGKVLFHNSTPAAILARVEGILGRVPAHMIQRGRYAHRYYTPDGKLYQRSSQTGQVELLRPKKSSLAARVREANAGMLDFLNSLLQVDPAKRPSAAEALQHPWLEYQYA